MEALKILGKSQLKGVIRAQGAKNAVTKLLVASLLSDKKCRFYNVPDISEVEITVALCQEIGMEIAWDRENKVMEVCTKHLNTSYVPQRFSGANRIPILMIGALLGRTDQDIIVPVAGGCLIGKRPVDFHIEALRQLGATIEYKVNKHQGAYYAQAPQGLKGTVIQLPYPSVGATENTILAAITAKGETVVKNAAIEPEIVDLILFLQKVGANITLDADRTIRIQGTRKFYEVEHSVIPDRIEAASWGMAALATKGSILVEGTRHVDMITFLNKIREIGGGFRVKPQGIEFFYDGPMQGGVQIETGVHPGFATDWQQPFVVLLTQSQGASVVHETVYENRFGYTDVLKKMGGDISLFHQCLGGRSCRFASRSFPHSLIVRGQTPLTAAQIAIPDLRAGFSYVLAALIAEGVSTITGLPYLDRGYEDVVGKLQLLGAEVERVQLDDQPEALLFPKSSRSMPSVKAF